MSCLSHGAAVCAGAQMHCLAGLHHLGCSCLQAYALAPPPPPPSQSTQVQCLVSFQSRTALAAAHRLLSLSLVNAGAYIPAFLAKRDRLAGGSGRSLAYVLGNMLRCGGVLPLAGCWLCNPHAASLLLAPLLLALLPAS